MTCPNCGGRDRHYFARCLGQWRQKLCKTCGEPYTGAFCINVACFTASLPTRVTLPLHMEPRPSSAPYRLPLEVGPRDVTYARRRAAYLARQRVSVTDAVALLVPEVCSRERIWGAEDRDLIQAAVIDSYNRVRWAEVEK